MDKIDPVKLSLIWESAVSIPQEVANVIGTTGYSDLLREGQDYSAALFNREGELISQGLNTPGHLGSMPYLMKEILRNKFFPLDVWKPSTIVCTNDPYLGAGHLPDLTMVMPAFVDSYLAGFAAVTIHLVDIGGISPGSISANASNIFQEGLQIPLVKLMENSQLNADLIKIIKQNSRMPELVEGDINAAIAALFYGARRFQELVRTYGARVIERYFEEIIQRSENYTREVIGKLPPIEGSFEDHMDDYGRGTKPIKIKVTVKKEGTDLVFDFTGTDPQVDRAINSTLSYTRAYVITAAKAFINPDLPQNSGSLRPIKIHAPEGSFVNPKPPAPVAARAMSCHRIFDVLLGALHVLFPDKVCGAAGGCEYFSFSGFNTRTQKRFAATETIYGGLGARVTKDGINSIAFPNNLANIPIEVLETRAPYVIERYELIQDSGGDGKYRGGLGARRDYRLFGDCRLVYKADRHTSRPWGAVGGKEGVRGKTLLIRNGKEEELHPKDEYDLKAGDFISIQTPSGGGSGKPEAREASRIIDDLKNEYISKEKAETIYRFEKP